MDFPKVAQIYADDFLTKEGKFISGLLECLNETCKQLDLTVIVTILSHNRVENQYYTIANIFTMHKHLQWFDGLRFYLSYQGQVPKKIVKAAKANQVSIVTHDSEKFCDEKGNEYAFRSGKTENLLTFLSKISRIYDPPKTYVVILDDDYVILDWFNILMLFAPWVFAQGIYANLNFPETIRSLATKCKFVQFTKGGGSRIVIPRGWTKNIVNGGNPVYTFATFCLKLLSVTGSECDASCLSDDGIVVTPENLPYLISVSAVRSIEKALELYTRSGGRNGRALGLYLCSRQHLAFEGYLSQFSFLLHGDQGTTLENWLGMHLGRGYALELSFLANALFKERFKKFHVANIITIPHAHLPKDEISSFEMGLDLFYHLGKLKQQVLNRWSLPKQDVFDKSNSNTKEFPIGTSSTRKLYYFTSHSRYRFKMNVRTISQFDYILYPPLESMVYVE